ncbi:mite group 2 allergen Lep d 2-like [Culicoides brevitarsis]|uniref:mite group 2 allergen Lep d 2-like n=1 Tax=Culicoides brevitarsis TaxID=469753 RepID=UPI00307C2600
MQKFAVILLFAIVGSIYCENYEFNECTKTVGEDDNVPDHYNCNVTAVRISPCSEYPCKIKRGKKVALEVDFVSSVAVDTVENDVYWASPEGDLEWQGLAKDGCANTQCPVAKDVQQSYTYSIDIDKKVPVRMYDVKWGFKSGDQVKCCALIRIHIRK